MADSHPLLSAVSQCLHRSDWNHTVDLEKSMILVMYTIELASLRMVIAVQERTQRIILMISLERRCPRKYRDTMSDFCNRTNFQIPSGFFAMDKDNGEVRYRSSVDVEGTEVNPVFVNNLVRPAFGSVQRCYRALQKIMAGFSIESAMEEIPNH
jgi:hypothetical protein